ncbi:hypothetical protein HK104_001370, partial [Borealophlyctis nickersoniae]
MQSPASAVALSFSTSNSSADLPSQIDNAAFGRVPPDLLPLVHSLTEAASKSDSDLFCSIVDGLGPEIGDSYQLVMDMVRHGLADTTIQEKPAMPAVNLRGREMKDAKKNSRGRSESAREKGSMGYGIPGYRAGYDSDEALTTEYAFQHVSQYVDGLARDGVDIPSLDQFGFRHGASDKRDVKSSLSIKTGQKDAEHIPLRPLPLVDSAVSLDGEDKTPTQNVDENKSSCVEPDEDSQRKTDESAPPAEVVIDMPVDESIPTDSLLSGATVPTSTSSSPSKKKKKKKNKKNKPKAAAPLGGDGESACPGMSAATTPSLGTAISHSSSDSDKSEGNPATDSPGRQQNEQGDFRYDALPSDSDEDMIPAENDGDDIELRTFASRSNASSLPPVASSIPYFAKTSTDLSSFGSSRRLGQSRLTPIRESEEHGSTLRGAEISKRFMTTPLPRSSLPLDLSNILQAGMLPNQLQNMFSSMRGPTDPRRNMLDDRGSFASATVRPLAAEPEPERTDFDFIQELVNIDSSKSEKKKNKKNKKKKGGKTKRQSADVGGEPAGDDGGNDDILGSDSEKAKEGESGERNPGQALEEKDVQREIEVKEETSPSLEAKKTDVAKSVSGDVSVNGEESLDTTRAREIANRAKSPTTSLADDEPSLIKKAPNQNGGGFDRLNNARNGVNNRGGYRGNPRNYTQKSRTPIMPEGGSDSKHASFRSGSGDGAEPIGKQWGGRTSYGDVVEHNSRQWAGRASHEGAEHGSKQWHGRLHTGEGASDLDGKCQSRPPTYGNAVAGNGNGPRPGKGSDPNDYYYGGGRYYYRPGFENNDRFRTDGAHHDEARRPYFGRKGTDLNSQDQQSTTQPRGHFVNGHGPRRGSQSSAGSAAEWDRFAARPAQGYGKIAPRPNSEAGNSNSHKRRGSHEQQGHAIAGSYSRTYYEDREGRRKVQDHGLKAQPAKKSDNDRENAKVEVPASGRKSAEPVLDSVADASIAPARETASPAALGEGDGNIAESAPVPKNDTPAVDVSGSDAPLADSQVHVANKATDESPANHETAVVAAATSKPEGVRPGVNPEAAPFEPASALPPVAPSGSNAKKIVFGSSEGLSTLPHTT